MTFRERVARLKRVRGTRPRSTKPDQAGVLVQLDGATIPDVPGLYLAIGEAFNGPEGYFGACLDSLSDCLCGGFGFVPPISMKIVNASQMRRALGVEARRVWLRSREQSLLDDESISEQALGELGVPYAEIGDESTYFELVVEVLRDGGVNVVLHE